MKKLVTFVAERFILIAVIGVIEIILSLVSPDSLYNAAVDFMFGQVYVNAFLGSLNSRQSLKGKGVQDSAKPTTRTTRLDLSRSQRMTAVLEMDTIADSSVADIGEDFMLCTADFRGTETSC